MSLAVTERKMRCRCRTALTQHYINYFSKINLLVPLQICVHCDKRHLKAVTVRTPSHGSRTNLGVTIFTGDRYDMSLLLVFPDPKNLKLRNHKLDEIATILFESNKK